MTGLIGTYAEVKNELQAAGVSSMDAAIMIITARAQGASTLDGITVTRVTSADSDFERYEITV